MNADRPRPAQAPASARAKTPVAEGPSPRGLYLQEPGWQVGLKVGSAREFCHTMAPGQGYYHRLSDGEIFLYRNDERICVACAERRGLLSYEPRILRGRPEVLDLDVPEGPPEFDIGPPR